MLSFEENKNNIKYDYILDLDITSPLRTTRDLSDAFEMLKKNNDSLNIFSVNKAARNPYFNMVEKKLNGYYNLVKSSDVVLSRQEAPNVYDMNASFYFYKRSFFEKKMNTVISERSLIYVMPHICFDLDHRLDFDFLEFLLIQNKLDFPIW